MAGKNNKTSAWDTSILTIPKDFREGHYVRGVARCIAIFFVIVIALACGMSTGYAVFALWGFIPALIFGGASFFTNLLIFVGGTQEVAVDLFTRDFWKNTLFAGDSRTILSLLGMGLSIACGFVSFGYTLVATTFVLTTLGLGATAIAVLPYIIAFSMSVGMTFMIFKSIEKCITEPKETGEYILGLFSRKPDESRLAHVVRVICIVLSLVVAVIATIATVNAWGDKLTVFFTTYGATLSTQVVNTVVAAFVWTAFVGNLIFNAKGLIEFSEIVIRFFDKIGGNCTRFATWLKNDKVDGSEKAVTIVSSVFVGVLVCLNGLANGAVARGGSTPMGSFPNIQMSADSLRSGSMGGVGAVENFAPKAGKGGDDESSLGGGPAPAA